MTMDEFEQMLDEIEVKLTYIEQQFNEHLPVILAKCADSARVDSVDTKAA